MGNDFRDLAQEYAGKVFTYARYALRDHQDAEDVTQEVLIRLWKNHDSIEPSRLSAWVMRVTRNLVIDCSRRHRTRAAVFVDGPAAETSAASVAAAPTPDAHAGRAELREVIERAIAELDEPQRSIVVMREIQGLAYEEIADALNMPLGTVKVYLHRARRRMRERVRAQLGEHV
ncbi:MAG TPA: sigma-70 family RNA polymerase sigma factor [Candidatus Krumholzibacteria bacterium]|nr:sigma-70 family RNA polymerase sigma factor [Candidatus Krumholzibacteria bacterium]